MRFWICVKVVEGDAEEPICETRIATSERDACIKLLELWDDSPWSEDWDPFSLAQTISGDGRFFYVEEHDLAQSATPEEIARIERQVNATPVARDTERFKRPMEGAGVN